MVDLRLEEAALERNFPATILAALETKRSALVGEAATALEDCIAEGPFLRKKMELLGCRCLIEFCRDEALGMELLGVVVLLGGDDGASPSRASEREYPSVKPTETGSADTGASASIWELRFFISWNDSCKLSKNLDMPPRFSSTKLVKLLLTLSPRYAGDEDPSRLCLWTGIKLDADRELDGGPRKARGERPTRACSSSLRFASMAMDELRLEE